MSKAGLAIVALVALLSFANSLSQGPRTGFNPDESRWISRAHFLREITDPFGPTWSDRYTTRGQPPVGSYATGLGLVVQGRDLFTNLPWEFSYQPGTPGWYRNMAEGRMPTPDDLATARRTSAAYVALTAAVVAVIGWTLGGVAAAAGAGIPFALHPFSAYVGSIATSDAVFGLLIALAALAAARLGRRPTVAAALLLGVALGLGGGTKLSPLLVAPVVGTLGGVLLGVDAVRRRGFPRDRLGWLLASVPIVALVIFVGSYPYLWPDPVGRTRNLVEFRTTEMQAQSTDWPVMAVPTRTEAVRRIGVNFAERYSLSGLVDRASDAIVGASPGLGPFDLLAALVGLLLWSAGALQRGPRDPAALALLVLLSLVAVTIGGMRSEFDRYHVPMALLGALAIGVLVAHAFPVVRRVSRGVGVPACRADCPRESASGRA